MSTVKEIEAAIEKLPRHELWQLKAHLDRRCEEEWDAQIEEDARPGGPLDKLAQSIAHLPRRLRMGSPGSGSVLMTNTSG